MGKKLSNIRAAVVGGSSITGGEVCRLLLNHPNINSILPTSRSQEPFERVHQNLQGSGLSFYNIEDLINSSNSPNVVFFCTPSGEAMKYASKFLNLGAYIIDVSSDFRFRNAADFEHVYGMKHLAPDLLPKAICGITELYRDEISSAKLVANPGCYVIASVLGLVPLLKSSIIDYESRIHICAVNGTTGAGSNVRRELHHAYAFGSMLPYSLNGHRHRLEIEKRLQEVSGRNIAIDLTTVHGNFARGIISLISIPVNLNTQISVDRQSLLNIYKDFYRNENNREYFVVINDFNSLTNSHNSKEYDIYPSLARVVGSNYCHIGVDYDKETHIIKVVSVIDNLVKGAAGSAIQNMNVMIGIKEQEGLCTYGI
jgi:N-acetyl-gamma-glutamyl-phosphate reductase